MTREETEYWSEVAKNVAEDFTVLVKLIEDAETLLGNLSDVREKRIEIYDGVDKDIAELEDDLFDIYHLM